MPLPLYVIRRWHYRLSSGKGLEYFESLISFHPLDGGLVEVKYLTYDFEERIQVGGNKGQDMKGEDEKVGEINRFKYLYPRRVIVLKNTLIYNDLGTCKK